MATEKVTTAETTSTAPEIPPGTIGKVWDVVKRIWKIPVVQNTIIAAASWVIEKLINKLFTKKPKKEL